MSYEPKAGTKAETALQALDGPMTSAQLAAVLGVHVKGVEANLATPLKRGAIIRVWDETGKLHFHRADSVLPDRFSISKGDMPSVQPSNIPPGEIPQLKTYNPADPFGLVAKSSQLAQSVLAQSIGAAAPEPKEEKPQPIAAPMPKAMPTVSEHFVAGLFSNGELQITVGERTLTLSAAHTRELFDYLDKVVRADA